MQSGGTRTRNTLSTWKIWPKLKLRVETYEFILRMHWKSSLLRWLEMWKFRYYSGEIRRGCAHNVALLFYVQMTANGHKDEPNLIIYISEMCQQGGNIERCFISNGRKKGCYVWGVCESVCGIVSPNRKDQLWNGFFRLKIDVMRYRVSFKCLKFHLFMEYAMALISFRK